MRAKKSHYIQDLILEGEHEHQDFKYQITDARKIARSIAAFANNSGGHLLIGVKDNGNIAGVRSEEEIYMIETAAQMYCRPEQQVSFKVYNINGKQVVKADIAEAVEKPVEAPDDNGQWHVYYRVADENVLASRLHERILSAEESTASDPEDTATISYSGREQKLLEYLRTHGGITLDGFMKLAHISEESATKIVVALHGMGLLSLQYHDGQCLIVGA
jgi:predicted HTH transcriptional regulator